MPVQSRAMNCTCGRRLLASSDQALGKAYKDHMHDEHEQGLSLEDALGVVEERGFDPQDDEGIEMSASR